MVEHQGGSCRASARRRRRDSEEGAFAILFAILLVLLFAFAAFAVDISRHVEVRQSLHDTLDAAAHAGVAFMPDDPAAARRAAIDYALANDPSLIDPDNPPPGGLGPDDTVIQVDFFCIIGSDAGAPIMSHIGIACGPGIPPNGWSTAYVEDACPSNQDRCYIPCNPFSGVVSGVPTIEDNCNTVRVRDSKTLDYVFAPVIGIRQGGTGTLAGAACKGYCGQELPPGVDIVLVLDRTASMRDNVATSASGCGSSYSAGNLPGYRQTWELVNPDTDATHTGTACYPRGEDMSALREGVRALLDDLDPVFHHVGLVVHGPSITNAAGCPTGGVQQTSYWPTHQPGTAGPDMPLPGGSRWVAAALNNAYKSSSGALNEASALVRGVTCLRNSIYGTNLGDPLQAAANHLVTNGRPGAQRFIMFMTDGEPTLPHGSGVASADGMSAQDCRHARDQAAAAQAVNPTIHIVVVAYRLQNVQALCPEGSIPATRLLAQLASDPPDGPATADDGGGAGGGCVTEAQIHGENTDDDYLFCAPGPEELREVLGSLRNIFDSTIRLVQVPD